jgi:hypothetical protein
MARLLREIDGRATPGDSMASDKIQDEAAARQQHFTFYAANGRIYARNVAQKVIDLGAISRGDGGFAYELDGNHRSAGGFKAEQEALRDIAKHVRYLWLDGQFTAVADARDNPGLNLDGAAQLDVMLDELPPGERIYDATV